MTEDVAGDLDGKCAPDYQGKQILDKPNVSGLDEP